MPDSINSTRRDLLLEQMGITQFELRRPMALKGEVAISLPSQVRLVIVIGQLPDLNTPFWQDILRSLSLTDAQVYCLTPEQTVMLPENPAYALWRIGEIALPETLTGHTLQLTSPDIDELAASPAAKRDLWRQICHHEHYFITHA